MTVSDPVYFSFREYEAIYDDAGNITGYKSYRTGVTYQRPQRPAPQPGKTQTPVIDNATGAIKGYVIGDTTGAQSLIIQASPVIFLDVPEDADVQIGATLRLQIYVRTAERGMYGLPTNATAPIVSVTGLPLNLRFDAASGIISGTCNVSGVFGIAVSARTTYTDYSNGFREENTGRALGFFNISVWDIPEDIPDTPETPATPPPVVSAIPDRSVVVGGAVSAQIAASNDPTSYSATGLPPGVTCNGGTGAISGTVNNAGTYTVTARATNAGGTGSTTFRIAVSEVVGGRSWWAAKIARRLRRAIWADRFLEYRRGIWWRLNYNPTSLVVSSEAPVQAADFTEAEFRAQDWVTSNLPGTADEAGGNNWRWARAAARAGRQVARAAWSRRYLEMAAGGIWYAVWTGSTGGVTTRRVAAAGDITGEDFRARDWRSVGGTGIEPPPDDEAVVP